MKEQWNKVLNESVVLHISQMENGYYFVTHPIILTHGYGKDPKAAIDDFKERFFDLLDELTEFEDKLSERLKRQLDFLRGLFD